MAKKKPEVKAASTEPAKAPAKKPAELLQERVLAIMQKLAQNGVVEVGSRLVSDKLNLDPDKGRTKVRNTMKRLEKAGKVVIERKAVKEKGAQKRYFYRLKE